LIEATDLRVDPILCALRGYSQLERFAWRLRWLLPRPLRRVVGAARRLLARVVGLRTPRIGRLRHYDPRPLHIPTEYHQTLPPPSAPTVSIVTPSFQYGRFIERTIRSVLEQRYPELEYIVQDGGSTDETVDVLLGFGDRIVWRSEPDGGHADALNRAFASTKGEIMAWVNSDDILLPGALAYVTSFFAEHPEVDVVYGDRLMIDDDDNEVGAWILPEHDDLVLTLADFVPQETLFWRRRIWESSGARLDDSFHYALDWELLLRFRDAGARMVHLPRFLGAFRVHNEQRTSTAFELGQEEMMRLRERTHGRRVPLDEVHRLITPYLHRHVRAHMRYRLAERAPILRRGRQSGARALPPVRAVRAIAAERPAGGER